MSSKPALVLDNCILSSFHCSGWLASISIWSEIYTPVVTHRVWENEFIASHEIDHRIDSVSVTSVELSATKSEVPGQLSKADWSCILAAEQADKAQLVTNDFALKKIAEERGIATLWGTAFVMKTYRKCGISAVEFDDGLSEYVDDVTLPERVREEVAATEKPE